MLELLAAVFDWSGGASRRKFWSMAALYFVLVFGTAGLEFAFSDVVAFHRLSFALAGAFAADDDFPRGAAAS